MQLQVKNSPFNEEQVVLLNQLLPGIDEKQQIWLSGYLTALNGFNTSTAGIGLSEPISAVAPVVKEATIIFGSQTGNGEAIAEELTATLKSNGYDITLTSMSDFKPNALKKIEHLLLIVSTHGEGDPPDTAIPFHDFMHGRRAPQLEHLKYSILSLGDSSYDLFCQTGKDFDVKLSELGATPLTPRIDCDLDYDEPVAEWFEAILHTLNKATQGTGAQQTNTDTTQTEVASAFSRTNPFQAEVYENINLNGRGSNKVTRHLEISLEDSGLTYEPGDSLGVFPQNDASLVDAIIDKASWDENEFVTINKQGEQLALRDALLNHYEVTVLTKPLVQNISLFTTDADFHALLKEDNKAALDNYIHGRDLLDLFTDFSSWNAKAAEFTAMLRKMPARLYSVASSLSANPEEVHLTVGVVEYEVSERKRHGVCSVQLAENVEPGDKLAVYVHKNNNFRLPKESETPIIMIGPGTGIAPFRAFMEEREAIEATGKSWLFFGDQHFTTDFLYQIEWQKWLKDGVLTKMDVAFSRDTAEKVYVQHRMLEHAQELYEWINAGAVIYVCGDEEYMAKDVHQTLVTILEDHGGLTNDAASDYLKNLIQEKRYLRDVY